MSGTAQVQLTQWLLQAQQTGHLFSQRQRSQAFDRETARRHILDDIGEHALDLILHLIADPLHIVLDHKRLRLRLMWLLSVRLVLCMMLLRMLLLMMISGRRRRRGLHAAAANAGASMGRTRR